MNKHLESVYQNLLGGRLPHNLSWSEAVQLVEHLGEVQSHGNDEFVFRVGHQRVFFKRPHTHDLGSQELSRLRKFLKEARPSSQVEEPTQPSRIIVVIDHHTAHVYQDFGGSRPADEHKVQPYDPFHFHHHLTHRKEAHYRGERVPEEDSFYEEIAEDIAPANEIVLIGHATAKSNAADFLKEYLRTHHPDISRRVIATESADLSVGASERGREFFGPRQLAALVNLPVLNPPPKVKRAGGEQMKAARVLQFGPPSVITNDELPRPEPAAGQLLVHVKAAGVGPWDALIREGKSGVHESLPLILGSELSGIVKEIGAEVSGFRPGDEVYGATNEQFTGAYAEYALPSAKMMAQKPKTLSFVEAASAPIVTVTAWQMLFDYAHVKAGQTVLIHGAAGNVGAYAVQLAKQAGLHVAATAASTDLDYVRALGAERVVDYKEERFEDLVSGIDVVLDTVGGDTQQRSLRILKPGGILVSVVSPVSETIQKRYGVRAAYFYVDVTTARLNKITELFDSGKLVTDVGTVLRLEEARVAHEMLDGAPHKRGKIVLSMAA